MASDGSCRGNPVFSGVSLSLNVPDEVEAFLLRWYTAWLPTHAEITAPSALDAPPTRLISAAQEAVRAALREHKLAGNSIAVWRDGKVVLLPPEEIEV